MRSGTNGNHQKHANLGGTTPFETGHEYSYFVPFINISFFSGLDIAPLKTDGGAYQSWKEWNGSKWYKLGIFTSRFGWSGAPKKPYMALIFFGAGEADQKKNKLDRGTPWATLLACFFFWRGHPFLAFRHKKTWKTENPPGYFNKIQTFFSFLNTFWEPFGRHFPSKINEKNCPKIDAEKVMNFMKKRCGN